MGDQRQGAKAGPARRPLLGRAAIGAVAFTAAYLSAAAYFAVRTGNAEFRFYIIVMLVLIAAVAALHARVRLSGGALWCLSIWGLAHMAGGLVPVGEPGVLYSLWLIPGKLKYDQVVHAYGFAVATWVCWEGLRARLVAIGDPRPTLGTAALCVLAGMGLGALNEIVEFAATQLMPETNVGDYVNNATDLVFNAMGATAAGVVVWVRGRGQTSHTSRASS